MPATNTANQTGLDRSGEYHTFNFVVSHLFYELELGLPLMMSIYVP